MNKLNVFLMSMLFALVCFTSKAQSQKNDYFVGKWDVTVPETPNGSEKSLVVLERKGGKLIGTFKSEGMPEVKIDKVEEKEKSTTIYFNASGYDVYFVMEKKDDNYITGNIHMTGNVKDKYAATGVRVKAK